MSTNRYDFLSQSGTDTKHAAHLLYISSAKYTGDWHSTPHTHSCSELFYVTNGSGQFLVEDEFHPVSVHDLVIINPYVRHTETSLNSRPMEYIVLGVEGLELSVHNQQDSRFCIVSFHGIRDMFLLYLQQMIKEINTRATGYETVCQNLMEILAIHLMRQSNFTATLSPVLRNSTSLCASVRRYMDEHYKESITLDMLAQMFHVSKYHMAHLFTETYKISPINYMLSLRIQEAKQLLQTTDYSLSLISRMLGFSSPSYFSQSFRKQTGTSPQEYRRQYRLSQEPE